MLARSGAVFETVTISYAAGTAPRWVGDALTLCACQRCCAMGHFLIASALHQHFAVNDVVVQRFTLALLNRCGV
ncbi:hypothetical protein KCP69_04545 [Salmonella enterica subsp. enterica]|nr:hypothetical protein KCP69_04545 [Salmonella enterica subsp. enterica]